MVDETFSALMQLQQYVQTQNMILSSLKAEESHKHIHTLDLHLY
jgi:hypothetical protein